MRRSKRLQAKKTVTSSENEGSRQDETGVIETLESTSKENDYIALKTTNSEDEEENDEQVFCVDRIGSSQDELLANAGNSSSLSETDEFLSIPDEFKRKVKE